MHEAGEGDGDDAGVVSDGKGEDASQGEAAAIADAEEVSDAGEAAAGEVEIGAILEQAMGRGGGTADGGLIESHGIVGTITDVENTPGGHGLDEGGLLLGILFPDGGFGGEA